MNSKANLFRIFCDRSNQFDEILGTFYHQNFAQKMVSARFAYSVVSHGFGADFDWSQQILKDFDLQIVKKLFAHQELCDRILQGKLYAFLIKKNYTKSCSSEILEDKLKFYPIFFIENIIGINRKCNMYLCLNKKLSANIENKFLWI